MNVLDDPSIEPDRRLVNRVAGVGVVVVLIAIAIAGGVWFRAFLWPVVMPSGDGSN